MFGKFAMDFELIHDDFMESLNDDICAVLAVVQVNEAISSLAMNNSGCIQISLNFSLSHSHKDTHATKESNPKQARMLPEHPLTC